jgi:hypothetical protein
MLENLPIQIHGHLTVTDISKKKHKVLVDKDNAIHPQNMARAISRALANESNFWVNRIAFGNGGTFIGATYDITYRTVNDGQSPDSRTWDSRPYSETYSEIIDEGSVTLNPLLGTDPGSADSSGIRAGGGAVPGSDPTSIPNVSGPGVRSNELGLTSEVVISCVLNPNEPTGEFLNDSQLPQNQNPESSFMFDEIALFTSGAPAVATSASQDIDVGNKTAFSDTGLTANTLYDFFITSDGSPVGGKHITFTTPVAGGSGTAGEILYGDLIKAIRTGNPTWNAAWAGVNPLPGNSNVNITNDGSFDVLVPTAQTYGFLRFVSGTTGVSSSMSILPGTTHDMIAALNAPTGGVIKTAVAGKAAGVQNDPVNPTNERERMLTHVIFSPVLKSKNRTLAITYTLTISVARTV